MIPRMMPRRTALGLLAATPAVFVVKGSTAMTAPASQPVPTPDQQMRTHALQEAVKYYGWRDTAVDAAAVVAVAEKFRQFIQAGHLD